MATTHSVSPAVSSVPDQSAALPPFSTYPVSKLLQLWSHAELTSDQMIGHLTQHIAGLEQRVYRLEHQQRTASASPSVAATT